MTIVNYDTPPFLRYEVRRHFVIQVLSSKLYLLCHFDRARAFFG